MLYFASISSGFIQAIWPNPNVLWGIAIFMAVSGIFWVQLDAKHREKPIPGMALLLLLFVWMLFVPIYLIWTRGLKGFGWALIHIIGLYVATLCSFLATLFITYGPEAFQAFVT